jgi:hypothetical protein
MAYPLRSAWWYSSFSVVRARFTVAPVTSLESFAYRSGSCLRADLKSSTISLVISSMYLPLKNRHSALRYTPESQL